MIEPYQFPETCSCCNETDTDTDSSGGSGSSRDWILFGEVPPEGVVTADRRTIYRRRNDEYYEFYMKESGDGSPFGWVLYHQVSAPVV